MPGPESSPAQLDAFARQNGYQSYAQMQAFLTQRSASLRRSTTTEQGVPASAAPRPAPVDNRSWYQRLFAGLGGQ